MSIQRVALRGMSAEQQLTRHAESINGLIAGKLDVTGEITLTASSTTTSVVDTQFESQMVPLFVPLTANASAALGGLYVSARSNGGFTLTHASNAQTDKTFAYVRLG